MVKIDFERPGIDSQWGATPKYWNGFPMESKAMRPQGSVAEIEEQSTIDDLEYNALQDFDLMTALARDLACQKNADSRNLLEENFEANLSEELAYDENSDIECKLEEGSEGQHHQQESSPSGDQNVNELVIGDGIPPATTPTEEQQTDQESTKPTMEGQHHQQEIKKELTSTTKRRRLDDCFSYFAKLFKPQLTHPVKPNPVRALPPRAASELDQALLESASFHEAKELSVSLARVRLQNVMEKYQAKVRPVEADGNCQFRALALQLRGNEDQHGEVRAEMVQWLQKKKERYSDFVHEPYDEFIERMARDGEWGDNVTLQAASDMLCRDIHILNDQPGAERISLHPAEMAGDVADKPLWLAFLAELHYDSVEFL